MEHRRIREQRAAARRGDGALTRGGRLVRLEALHRVSRELELHPALGDRADTLRRDVHRLADEPGRDGEPVEDVCVLVAKHLVDRAYLLAGGVDDVPAVLQDKPGDWVAQTDRPPTYQTGPCV